MFVSLVQQFLVMSQVHQGSSGPPPSLLPCSHPVLPLTQLWLLEFVCPLPSSHSQVGMKCQMQITKCNWTASKPPDAEGGASDAYITVMRHCDVYMRMQLRGGYLRWCTGRAVGDARCKTRCARCKTRYVRRAV